MPTIIKKGTNNSAFRLKNGHVVVLRAGLGGGDHLNILSDQEYDALMAEYGTFIKPRVFSDRNPTGCFIIHDKREYAKDQGAEVGEVRDNSAPIEIDKIEKKPAKRKRK